MNSASRTRGMLATWLLGCLVTFAVTSAHAIPENGWWWNANESGRGFFLETQGPNMFLSGYFYAADGRATWLVSNDPMPDPNAYDGRLLAFRDGQSLMGDYRHPAAAVDAGPISLRFTDSRHGTLAWAGGTVAIVRYDFQNGPDAAFQPKTGWWWNPRQSGRGFSIELQGNHMFIGAYMYDAAGNPVWYVADALMQSPQVFTGPLLQFANGQTLTGPYRAPAAPVSVGTITVEFSATDQAAITLSDDSTPPTKTSKKIIVLPQFEIPAVAPAAELWSGRFETTHYWRIDPIIGTITAEVPTMTWEQMVELDTGHYPAFYKIARGFAVVSMRQDDPYCVIAGSTSVDLSEGDLTVNANGSYVGRVAQTGNVNVTQTCTVDGQTMTVPRIMEYTIFLDLRGTIEGGVMQGTVQDPGIPYNVFSGSWNFTPTF